MLVALPRGTRQGGRRGEWGVENRNTYNWKPLKGDFSLTTTDKEQGGGREESTSASRSGVVKKKGVSVLHDNTEVSIFTEGKFYTQPRGSRRGGAGKKETRARGQRVRLCQVAPKQT